MAEPVLKVDKLVKDYGSYRAVDNVSFEIGKGQVVGLLGPNGAGKTTTIQMLIGITNFTSGRISYFGEDFSRRRQAALQRINSTSAYNTLLGRISVKENLMTFAGLYGVKNRSAKIAELLDKFEVGRLADRHYLDLSAGERTRVNLAKSLLNDPELVLMDEPTASLDPDIADKTLTWIEELRADHNLSILYTSHNMDEVERICDEVVFLDRGKVVSRGAPSDHTSRLNDVEILLTFRGDAQKIEDILSGRKLAYSFPSRNRVQVQAKRAQSAEVIAQVIQEGIAVSDTEIKKPDLEQVFLQIARGER